MNQKSVGATIATLRKKSEMTQADLAGRLGVSDKAISRWESGQGYPDLEMLPRLADLFGVSIDYILLGEKKGIAIAGNLILDIVKSIDEYPKMGMLAQISGAFSRSVGGCAPNTAVNLAKIDPRTPITVYGKVGQDENGRFIVSELQKNGINVSRLSYSADVPTSFCDVMSIPSGERTFFHQRGANAQFCPEDVDTASLNCDLLHIGYLTLLDRFDAADAKYGTVMARFLHDVQSKGIKTSIDMTSNESGNYGDIVIPAMKYCNYVIINEIECCQIFGLDARRADGSIHEDNVRLAMQKAIEAGVRDRVIVHAKECCFIMNAKGEYLCVPSLLIPPEQIKGSVGAGDAFCAGCLYGIYNDYSDKQILEFASAAAACNLFAENSVDGMRSKQEILALTQHYPRRSL